MKTRSIRLPVPHNILFIQDPDTNDLPEIEPGSAVWSTPSCIAVSCMPDHEGPTEVVIGPSEQVSQSDHMIFESMLKTPSRRVVVQIVPNKTILEWGTMSGEVRIRIWTDGYPDTNKVIVGVG